ncbi:hypothetical protein HHA01_21540 [Halomonas halmophila]|uniref:Uncharacterized protein n=2 Tax=Halomonas halmophila TaxID=252 RepID=A0A4Y4F147_9GAMM|nr:hypothetical protein HHA01_21540 [Halomonas halmophila]
MAAQPHFGHPLNEHYEPLSSVLETRGIDSLDDTLQDLVDSTREGGDWDQHTDAYQAAQEAIKAAMQDVDSEIRDDVVFQSRVQLALLKKAMNEYQAAIEDGEFVNVVEYQDSRGFVQVAKSVLEQYKGLYDNETYGTLLAAYEDTLKAWPSAVAPETPAMTPGELSASMFKLEAKLGEY